jgi:hypothetical protein
MSAFQNVVKIANLTEVQVGNPLTRYSEIHPFTF